MAESVRENPQRRRERRAAQFSLQERNECLHGLLRSLFHEPMPGIFEVDLCDGGRDELHLRG